MSRTRIPEVARTAPKPIRTATRATRSQRLREHDGPRYNSEQTERLQQIHHRLVEARRELDALIGDAYLRPRANIVPVHFLDLASAVEKLRWAEKEWRELDREAEEIASEAPAPRLVEVGRAESSAR